MTSLQTRGINPFGNLIVHDFSSSLPWTKYRTQTFQKDELIRTRPGLIYWVMGGGVRLESRNENPNLLAFIGKNRPFEVIERIDAFACIDRTVVSWFYPEHLTYYSRFAGNVNAGLIANSRHQLRLLEAISGRYTIDRLRSWLQASIGEFGVDTEFGRCLPWIASQEQIASAIGTTRVTVTRILPTLKKRGEILVRDRQIYLPIDR